MHSWTLLAEIFGDLTSVFRLIFEAQYKFSFVAFVTHFTSKPLEKMTSSLKISIVEVKRIAIQVTRFFPEMKTPKSNECSNKIIEWNNTTQDFRLQYYLKFIVIMVIIIFN